MDPPAEPVETENTRPNSSRAGSRNSVKFPTSKPLPPIGAQGDILPQDDSDSDTDSDLTDDDMENKEDDTRSTKSNLSRGKITLLVHCLYSVVSSWHLFSLATYDIKKKWQY